MLVALPAVRHEEDRLGVSTSSQRVKRLSLLIGHALEELLECLDSFGVDVPRSTAVTHPDPLPPPLTLDLEQSLLDAAGGALEPGSGPRHLRERETERTTSRDAARDLDLFAVVLDDLVVVEQG